MLPVQFLECILNLFIAKNIACSIGEFCAELLCRERTDYFTVTVMQQLMDEGPCCAMFPADTEQNSDPAPDSLQCKQKAKGSSLMEKKGVFIHAQAQALMG